MKKVLLAFVMVVGVTAGVKAQSLMIVSYDQETMINSSAVGDYGSHIAVKNNTSMNLDVMVKRHVFGASQCAFDSTYFCWDFCYTPDVSVSNGSMPINAGGIDDLSFAGHVYSNDQGLSCTDSVRYTFYVSGNANDSVSVVLKYTSGPNISVDENAAAVANAYPNPANDMFYIELANQPTSNTVVEVFNLLGSKVKHIDVQTQRTEINVSDLKSGIYLYTVTQDGQALDTQKLVVRH